MSNITHPDLVVACWRPETDEDWELLRLRARNWTINGQRLEGYPWREDPRETLEPPPEARGRSKKVEW